MMRRRNPSRAGTKIMIHVGVEIQLDSISQKGIFANIRQQPNGQFYY
jgi:hypothetical protein